MADEQGTGKHPHKSTEEPWPHREGQSQQGKESRSQSQQRQSSGSQQSNRSESQSEERDLKEREYRDSQGNVHHHTQTSKDMQVGKERKAS